MILNLLPETLERKHFALAQIKKLGLMFPSHKMDNKIFKIYLRSRIICPYAYYFDQKVCINLHNVWRQVIVFISIFDSCYGDIKKVLFVSLSLLWIWNICCDVPRSGTELEKFRNISILNMRKVLKSHRNLSLFCYHSECLQHIPIYEANQYSLDSVYIFF